VRKVFQNTNTFTLWGCAALRRSCRKHCRERRTPPAGKNEKAALSAFFFLKVSIQVLLLTSLLINFFI
jgi:hypothetical protein